MKTPENKTEAINIAPNAPMTDVDTGINPDIPPTDAADGLRIDIMDNDDF